MIVPMDDPDHAREIKKAVAIAALSALATSLITWGFDELKAYVAKRRGDGT